jgi:hypothetical protein
MLGLLPLCAAALFAAGGGMTLRASALSGVGILHSERGSVVPTCARRAQGAVSVAGVGGNLGVAKRPYLVGAAGVGVRVCMAGAARPDVERVRAVRDHVRMVAWAHRGCAGPVGADRRSQAGVEVSRYGWLIDQLGFDCQEYCAPGLHKRGCRGARAGT